MGIKFVKEGNACEHCRKQKTDVGKITHYQKHEIDSLLCESCITEFENDKCNECNNIREQSERDIPNNLCNACSQVKESNETRTRISTEKRNNFIKDNWKFWIGSSITIIIAIIGFTFFT